jgi:hypothetical protein
MVRKQVNFNEPDSTIRLFGKLLRFSPVMRPGRGSALALRFLSLEKLSLLQIRPHCSGLIPADMRRSGREI